MRSLRIAVIGIAMVAVACSGDAPQGSTTTTTIAETTTTTTVGVSTTPPTTAPPARDFGTEAEARAFLLSFNPLVDDPVELAGALAIAGGHRPGYETARWLQLGDEEVRSVVLAALAEGGSWNSQLLTAMATYGTPLGTYQARDPWDAQLRVRLLEAQDQALLATFGDLADQALVAQVAMLEAELLACLETGCAFAGAWYDVPQVVSLIDGTLDSVSFVGEIGVTSDTGEFTQVPVEMELGLAGWTIVAGTFAEVRTPVLVVEFPVDGFYVTDPLIAIAGLAELGTTVTVGDESFLVEFGGFWEVGADLAPGRNDLEVTAVNDTGGVTSAALTVYYAPQATERFGYIATLTEDTVVFNPAEYFEGQAAIDAAVAAGVIAEGETLPSGFFILDETTDTEELTVSGSASFVVFDADIYETAVSAAQLVELLSGQIDPGRWYLTPGEPFWVMVDGDTVLQIRQQYIP